jgi:hypothetical protein
VGIVVTSSLNLVELRGDARIRMGIPSDVAGSTWQTLARAWSVAFYEHPTAPDGIIYSSRLNDDTNLAGFDRAMGKLRADRIFRLIDDRDRKLRRDSADQVQRVMANQGASSTYHPNPEFSKASTQSCLISVFFNK